MGYINELSHKKEPEKIVKKWYIQVKSLNFILYYVNVISKTQYESYNNLTTCACTYMCM